MNPTSLTLGQRIMGDEPKFFKIVQILCFIALTVAGGLLKFHVGPPIVQECLAIGGIAGYGVAQFAVKEANLVITQGFTAATLSQAITDTSAEIDTVKAEINTPAAAAQADPAAVPAFFAPPPAPVIVASTPDSEAVPGTAQPIIVASAPDPAVDEVLNAAKALFPGLTIVR